MGGRNDYEHEIKKIILVLSLGVSLALTNIFTAVRNEV